MIMKSVKDISKDNLEKIYHINVLGDFGNIQAMDKQFKKQNDGNKVQKVINVFNIVLESLILLCRNKSIVIWLKLMSGHPGDY